MRLTKFGHACVRLESGGAVVVLDPGDFTDPEAVDGADAILITHEHPDHYSADHLRRTDAVVWTIGAVADVIAADAPDIAERVRRITPGQSFEPGSGISVAAAGELHAVIHPELPRITNSGYLLRMDGLAVFHPGDALTGPGTDVDLLLLPVSAPWLKVSEAIDFARDVGAPHNLAIHDRVYSGPGLGIVDGHLDRFLSAAGQRYVRIADGADLTGL